MKTALRFLVGAAILVLAASAFATPFTITSVTVNESYPAVVTWDATHIWVNWQGLNFTTNDFVNITINGGSGLTGVSGMLEYDFPCLGCLYAGDGGPFHFTVPSTILTENDPGFPFVVNDINDGGINISYLWSSSWSAADFNGEVFTFGSTPEPGSLALLGTGVLGLAGVLRRRIGL